MAFNGDLKVTDLADHPHGNEATKNFDNIDPTDFKGHYENAMHALETVKGIPKAGFKGCSGIILISSTAAGFFVGGQTGSGLALKRQGDSWSAPIAIGMGTVNVGAIIGKETKDMVILLNPAGMENLLTGDGQMKVGIETGFAAGPTGGEFGADLAGSDGMGFATSFVYTKSKGAMINASGEIGIMQNNKKVNQDFYGTDAYKSILDGKVAVPECGKEFVAKLHAALKEHQGREDTTAEKKGDIEASKEKKDDIEAEA